MTLESLQVKDLALFKAYCEKYRSEVDDSYLYDEDLDAFGISEDNPTYILKNETGQLQGVASLMVMEYLGGLKRARIRIIHTERGLEEEYLLLMGALKNHMDQLDHLFGFVSEKNAPLVELLLNQTFVIDRYSCVMVREDLPCPDAVFPESFKLADFVYDRDEWAYLKVRNAAFANLKGSETPQTLESLQSFRNESTHMDGGIRMLWRGEEPVGVIRIFEEIEKDTSYAFVAPIAIAPEYHGIGLGRQLLRAGIQFGKRNGMSHSMLTVNAENERATALYEQEGYAVVEKMICMRLDGFKKK